MANSILFSDTRSYACSARGYSGLKNAPVENISPHCEMLKKDFNLTVFQAFQARSRQSNFSRREEMSTSVFQSGTIEKERGIL